VVLHRIQTSTRGSIRLLEVDLTDLGVEMDRLGEISYGITREIGAAVAFLGHDGLMAPSARWKAENLVLFAENSSLDNRLEVIGSTQVDWLAWARSKNFL
jgi:hypothetical protein